MRIAHVDSESGFGGGEAQVFLLLRGLTAGGTDCVLFCPPGSASEARAAQLGIECRTLPMRNDLDVRAARGLAAGFKACDVQLVHLHTGRATWLGGLGARFAGCPAITTRRMDRPIHRGLKSRLTYGTLTDRVAAISPAVEEWLRRAGVPAERMELIPSAVDPTLLDPRRSREDVRQEFGAEPDGVVVLAVGALELGKGHDVLLQAWGRMENPPTLWIAGEGPARSALEDQAGPRVRFLGHRPDVPDLLGACDVFVMPSRHEGLGVAALEAMAVGRPVVASDVGGLSHAVEAGRTGLLVEPGDSGALAAALKRLTDDSALREALGGRGAARVRQHFLASQMVASYLALYRRILDRRATGR